MKLKELKSAGVPKGETVADLLTKVIDEHFRAHVRGDRGDVEGTGRRVGGSGGLLTKQIYAEVFQDLRAFAGQGGGTGAGVAKSTSSKANADGNTLGASKANANGK